MNKTTRFTAKRIIAFIISILLPVAVITLGALLFSGDAIFNKSIVITYVIVPLAAVALLALVIFALNKVALKVLLSVLVLIIFAVSFLWSNLIGTFELFSYSKNEEIGKFYAEAREQFPIMPTLNEVGKYTKAEHYDYFSTACIIFDCDADTLMLHYDAEEYEKQKALLDIKYVFQTEDFSEHGYSVKPSATIDGYNFRAIDTSRNSGYELYYPKKLVFIATNDSKNIIAYTAFYEDDLDYIEDLEEFLKNDCGWKHIIKRNR